MRQFSTFSAVTALAFCLVAGGATEARAGLGDVIWGMSGPQMIGYGLLRCRVPIAGGTTHCYVSEHPIGVRLDTIKERRAWVNLESTIYTSTGKNQEGTDYLAFHTYMLSFEPMVEVASKNSGSVRFFHGAGLAGHVLFGQDFGSFANAGFKVRPVAVELGDHWELAYNERYYPNGFGADQFGVEGAVPTARSFERTWGFTITVKK